MCVRARARARARGGGCVGVRESEWERERESITVPVHTFQSVNRCGGFAFRPVALLIETRLPKVDRNRNVSMMIGEDSWLSRANESAQNEIMPTSSLLIAR